MSPNRAYLELAARSRNLAAAWELERGKLSYSCSSNPPMLSTSRLSIIRRSKPKEIAVAHAIEHFPVSPIFHKSSNAATRAHTNRNASMPDFLRGGSQELNDACEFDRNHKYFCSRPYLFLSFVSEKPPTNSRQNERQPFPSSLFWRPWVKCWGATAA